MPETHFRNEPNSIGPKLGQKYTLEPILTISDTRTESRNPAKNESKTPDLLLDSIASPNRNRLKHLTANRVKGPKRRLPSKRIQKYTI